MMNMSMSTLDVFMGTH